MRPELRRFTEATVILGLTDVPQSGRQPTRAARDGGRSELRWRATRRRSQRGSPGKAARPRTGTNGCTSRSSAQRAADVVAWAMEHPSLKTACPQPFSPDPDRPLAPSEGSNDGSRDRGRAATGAGCERAPPDLPTADLPVGRTSDPRPRARTGGAAGARAEEWEPRSGKGARKRESAREGQGTGQAEGAGSGEGRRG